MKNKKLVSAQKSLIDRAKLYLKSNQTWLVA